jgi:hypothetical protein
MGSEGTDYDHNALFVLGITTRYIQCPTSYFLKMMAQNNGADTQPQHKFASCRN